METPRSKFFAVEQSQGGERMEPDEFTPKGECGGMILGGRVTNDLALVRWNFSARDD